MTIPDSIPVSLWAEFRKMRKKIKAPMTEHAETLILAKLERWRIEFNANPVDILNESIEKSWRGVFLNGHGAKSEPSAGAQYQPTGRALQTGVTPPNACKRCGTTQWSSLDRYKICERCQETTR